ncbi:hypothetical protein D0T66_12365 [Dysgonomonas sp. 25]|nr:hypothetical protein [Dysgonomonas sp. 25]
MCYLSDAIFILESSFSARREEWSPPLPLGVPRPMNYCVVLFVASRYNDNSLSFAGSIFFKRIRLRINPCCAATTVLCKRPSLLGHFLDDAFHFSKNAPISQRRAPFGILRYDDNGKRLLLVIMAVSIIAFCVWIDINIEKVFIWDM